MNKRHSQPLTASRDLGRPQMLLVLILASLAGVTGTACAYDIDTENPDVVITWNNTIRYNWAQRMQSRDAHVALAGPSSAYDEGDYVFNKGDTITNRLDLLTELNFAYQGLYGARLSATAWYDHAYGNRDKSAPGLAGSASYRNNEYTDYVKRYYHGPSGEFADAYIFGNFMFGEASANVRFGRHAVVWGEGLFGSTHSIAFSQSPSDARKSISSPGASAKETALPVHQISTTAVINPEMTLLAHYQFEWRPTRYPEGGTYFGPADTILNGPNVDRADPENGSNGSYGLGFKYSPEWLDGTIGLYYRKFDDNVGGWATQLVGAPTAITTKTVYAHDIELWGLSLSKSIGGVSVGAEVSHRKNDPLTSNTTATAGAANRYEGAIGETWHGLLNGVAIFGPSDWFNWSSAALSSEIAWSKLDKLTKNAALYRRKGYTAVCATATARIRGCVNDGDFLSLGVSFNPTWQQIYPGVDVSVPLFFSQNFGNSSSVASGSDGFITYKVGVTAVAWVRHQFDLSYTWFDQHIDRATPITANTGGRLLGSPYADKGFLAFTYQTTF